MSTASTGLMIDDMKPVRFSVNVPESSLVDLRERLRKTRFPKGLAQAEWDYGVDVTYLRELVDYWIQEYDWRLQERRLNSVPQYTVAVDGVNLHYVHVQGRGPAPVPLLFVHGWPGSFMEVLKILGPLTDPESHGGDPGQSFSVVAPSLPGFVFSGDDGLPGMNPGRIGAVLDQLMTDVLGYTRYVGQGGDWGSTILTRMAQQRPHHFIGLHLNYCSINPGSDMLGDLSEQERRFLHEHQQWNATEGAYNAIQATKPQTLGIGLNDSPAGLAGWLVEKYRNWSDCEGDVERAFTKDELLSLVTLYWISESIASSMRLYRERAIEGWALGAREKIAVPTAYARFPAEIRRPPREWLTRIYDLRRFTDMNTGGHFAAMEAPDLLVQDLRSFVFGSDLSMQGSAHEYPMRPRR